MQLAIFDIDGTLTKTTEIDNICFIRALADELGVTSINTNWSDYKETTIASVALQVCRKHLGRPPSPDEFSRIHDCFFRLLEQAWRRQPELFAQVEGAFTALCKLQQEPDWAIAIGSGTWRDCALLKLQDARLDVRSIPSAFADDSPLRGEILKTAIRRAETCYRVDRFQRIVYVGDAVWDVVTTGELGLAFVGLAADGTEELLRQAGASHIICDFTDYDLFLQTLGQARVPTETSN